LSEFRAISRLWEATTAKRLKIDLLFIDAIHIDDDKREDRPVMSATEL